ncbi:S-layer protein [Candidatus Woesearchaeota archaeon]|nr:S-layer protein [Candidatus Woesearchaeota archaeon]
MEIKKTIKKVVALGTGSVMLGATLMGAMAADLGQYPSMFVTADGKLDGVFVVGANARAADTVGATDIATHMTWMKPGGSTTTTVTGDAWKAATSSKILEVSEKLSSGTNAKTLYDINTYLGSGELNALADGTFQNKKSSYDYHQYLYLSNGTDVSAKSGYVQYTKSTVNDAVGDFLFFKNSGTIANYNVQFTSGAQSAITDSAGAAATTGVYLWDDQGKKISLLGKTYDIVQARRPASNGGGVKLVLMGGAIPATTLVEGQKESYKINGKDYTVKLSFVGTTTAKFTVNGETTDSLTSGQTYKLSDGTTIGVKEVLAQDFQEGLRQVEFYLGAQKVELQDTSVTDGTSSKSLYVDDKQIPEAYVMITGTDDNSTSTINNIYINLTAYDDYYIPAGSKLSSVMHNSAALLSSWDVEYRGIKDLARENIKVATSGSDTYRLTFADGDGKSATVPLTYTSGGKNQKWGDSNYLFHFAENNDTTIGNLSIARNDYFIVTDTTQTAGRRKTYALRYQGASKSTDTNPTIRFTNVATGDLIEVPYQLASAAEAGSNQWKVGTLKIGGASYNVYNMSVVSANNYAVMVDMDNTGALGSTPTTLSPIAINTNYGAKIDLGVVGYAGQSAYARLNATTVNATSSNSEVVTVNITTPNANDYQTLVPGPLTFDLTAASGQVAMVKDGAMLHSFSSPTGNSNTANGYTSRGAYVTFDTPTSNPAQLTVTYPKDQVEALVYFTTPSASVSSAATGTETAVAMPIPVTVFDTEVTDNTAQNMIVVGGPCANKVASAIMGNPTDCTEGFAPGKALFKLKQFGDKWALLVAGYDPLDTTKAAQILAQWKMYQNELKGHSELEVLTSNTGSVVFQTPGTAAAAKNTTA